MVRFGADKLHVVKEIDPATLEMLVPSMLLQPLIENSIKHGIEPRISGGTITMRSRLRDTSMMIEVEDDGVGMVESRTPGRGVPRKGTGIGMKNVRERWKCSTARRRALMSRVGRGGEPVSRWKFPS